MSVSREDKKVEAIKRMEALKLFKPCINAFKQRDEVQLSEMTGGLYEFNDDERLNRIVKDFEEQYNSLVYHVIHTFTSFGELYNLLHVSDYQEEWERDNADIKDGYALVYVHNCDLEWCSEFGSIAIEERFGGLVRVI